ncbi:arylesterase [Blastochloris sulfoviridis]|uniref:Arylesterase n=1 Tax=Blastochloris sulfoviridis TaxID=50712 RepID=A0A5M6I019_9HYPH|nr:arylesterase [Blastochloris sulfoviridis]
MLIGLGAAAMAALAFTPAPAGAEDGPIRLVALGDSLTAGYGLPADAALPAQLQARLEARGHKVVIANAGVSGDTASGGLERLDWAIAGDTEGVIVALGANDALRGIDPAVTRKALDTILALLDAKGLPVLLAGMYAPRNMGESYTRTFDAIYPDLARRHGAVLYPFLLEGVAGTARLNLGDGIHPTAEGVGLVAERLVPSVEELLARIRARRGDAKDAPAPTRG